MKGPDLRSGSAVCQPMAREGAFHPMVDYLVLIVLNTVGLCDQSPEKSERCLQKVWRGHR